MGAHSVKRLSKLGMVPDVPGMAALDMNSVSQPSQSTSWTWLACQCDSGCVCVCGMAPRAHSCLNNRDVLTGDCHTAG